MLAILTFSVPSNLIIEYAIYTLYGPDDFAAAFRISSLAGALLIPLYSIVAIRAASSQSHGDQASYRSLVRFSLAGWAGVFKARFLAAMLVGLGTLALVVPGVVLAVRFAFVEVVAIAENLNGTQARKRSAQLASGRARTILRLLATVACAAFVAAALAGFALGFYPQVDNFVSAAIGDSLFDVVISTLYGGAWFIYNAAQSEPPVDLPEPIS